MGAPGYSVNDLLKAISKCKDIYDAFAGEYDNAPARIQDLVDTCRYLHDVLGNIQWMFGDHNYPQESAFVSRLAECEDFIHHYQHLKKDFQKAHGARKDRWLAAWETTKYAFDHDRAEKLKHALSLEMQKLMLFILVFALRRNVQPSTSVAASTPLSPQDAEFAAIIKRFRSIRYKYEREMSMLALDVPRQPNLIGLYDELGSVWGELCLSAGFREEHLALPLPADGLLQTPSRYLNDMIINLTHNTAQPLWQQIPALPETLSEPRRPEPTPPSSPGLPSPPNFGGISPSSTIGIGPRPTVSASTSPIETQRPRRPPSSIYLPPPGLENHVVAMMFPDLPKNRDQLLRLSQWQCEHTGSHSKIVWTAENPSGKLEHLLPDGVFPDTLHSQLGKPLHVTFPGSTPHELIFIGEDRRPHHRIFIPEYMFMHTETRVKFQSDVRNKDLHCTFDTDIISTDLHPRDHGGLAVMQDLKIWQDRRTSLHSISFCTRDNEHFEFSILGFPRVRSTEKKAHLTRDQVLLESSEWRKHSSVASARPIVRKPSVWDFVTKTLQFRSLNAAPKSQLRPQEINTLIEKSNSPPDDTGDPTSARPTGPKHIRICFSKTEVGSAEQAANEFRRIFDNIYAANAAAPFQSHYELGGQSSTSRKAMTHPMLSPRQRPVDTPRTAEAFELDPAERPVELYGVPEPMELEPRHGLTELSGADGDISSNIAVTHLRDDSRHGMPDVIFPISTFSPFQASPSSPTGCTPSDLLTRSFPTLNPQTRH